MKGIPSGDQWQYEPKWDRFRWIAFHDGPDIKLQSNSLQPLARDFPELVAAIATIKVKRLVLDDEMAGPTGRGFSCDALLQRIHPAASRITHAGSFDEASACLVRRADPVLILHGAADHQMVVREARRLTTAPKRIGGTPQVHVYSD